MALPAYFETHRTDIVFATAWLVEINFTVIQRLTTWNDPVPYSGNTFTPAALDVEGVSTDSAGVASASSALTFHAGDDYWQALLASLTEAQRHPIVSIYEAMFDTTTLLPTPGAVRLVGTYTLESFEFTPSVARLTLAPVADPNLGRLPFREYGGGICTYRKFKGVQCGYAGATTTCDRTYDTCTALSNQARFGGFRELPDETVTIKFRWVNGETLREETLTLSRRSE